MLNLPIRHEVHQTGKADLSMMLTEPKAGISGDVVPLDGNQPNVMNVGRLDSCVRKQTSFEIAAGVAKHHKLCGFDLLIRKSLKLQLSEHSTRQEAIDAT
ncbi:MAG: hypothetical protein J4F49_02825 [Rhodobacteraceae bacterium]|nr:hypothetical protein [Paracoccaceae bacterium]